MRCSGPTSPLALVEAVEAALVSTPTPDLGGNATTDAFGDAVLASLALDFATR